MKKKKWSRVYDGEDIHFLPKDDLIKHEYKKCVCIPEMTGVVEGHLNIRWMYIHSSIDGRELLE